MVGYTCIDAEEIEMGIFLGLTGLSTYPRWATRNSKEKKKSWPEWGGTLSQHFEGRGRGIPVNMRGRTPSWHLEGRGRGFQLVWGQPDLHKDFQANHGYILRPCFKKEKTTEVVFWPLYVHKCTLTLTSTHTCMPLYIRICPEELIIYMAQNICAHINTL